MTIQSEIRKKTIWESDFAYKVLQGFRICIQNFKTLQILNLDFYNVSDFNQGFHNFSDFVLENFQHKRFCRRYRLQKINFWLILFCNIDIFFHFFLFSKNHELYLKNLKRVGFSVENLLTCRFLKEFFYIVSVFDSPSYAICQVLMCSSNKCTFRWCFIAWWGFG